MGRPQDEFCWENVDKLSDGRWRCKHCKGEFSGAASRIRKHLSGQGTDIRSCAAVSSLIRQEALKRTPMKGPRSVADMSPLQVSSSSSSNAVGVAEEEMPSTIPAEAIAQLFQVSSFQVPLFNNGLGLTTSKGSEEEVADAFVEFLMSRNVSVDFIQDSHFMSFLTKVARYGVPPSLIQRNSGIIQKSLWTFEHEVTLYMKMVKESWKTTGCAMMIYDFDQGNNKLVLGFYCPKGFIFVEADKSASLYKFTKDLKDHALNLSLNDVNIVTHPGHCSWHFSKCHYEPRILEDGLDTHIWTEELFANDSLGYSEVTCVRHQIERFYRKICEESKWVNGLIVKSEKIYQYIVSSNLYRKYYKTLKQERIEQFVDGKHASSLSRLGSIMELEQELRNWLSNLSEYKRLELENETDLSAIINNFEFWYDGNELLKALTPLSKIPNLMETLVPTAGYLYMAIDQAKRVLKTYHDRRSLKYSSAWYALNKQVEYDEFDSSLEFKAAYLSPACILSEARWDLKPTDTVKWGLQSCCDRVLEEALNAEMNEYNTKSNNPFANISISECKANHPVKLWYSYGSRFPVLQKCAIQILSQPVSCLCNQVKKHMSQLEETDNYILRLNYKMMQEFRNLGDDIYQPIDI